MWELTTLIKQNSWTLKNKERNSGSSSVAQTVIQEDWVVTITKSQLKKSKGYKVILNMSTCHRVHLQCYKCACFCLFVFTIQHKPLFHFQWKVSFHPFSLRISLFSFLSKESSFFFPGSKWFKTKQKFCFLKERKWYVKFITVILRLYALQAFILEGQ